MENHNCKAQSLLPVTVATIAEDQANPQAHVTPNT
jgi:hypothetical protein